MAEQLNRRQMLAASAVFALAGIPRNVWAFQEDEELIDFEDLQGFRTELRSGGPRIRCFDLRELTSFLTPEEQFYTFHQTQAVHADAAEWRLTVGGFVDHPKQFTLNELKQVADKREQRVTLECAGNARGPAANGLISTGSWSGVGLASVLRECGIKTEAREVAFFGMDLESEPGSPDAALHGRSVYVQDALSNDAMLAFALNGKPLSAERGFPLRAILPGWYGMTQIKWLTRIEVLDRRYEGSHMARNYHTMRAVEAPNEDFWIETSISKTRLKSVVARVARRKSADGQFRYRISGAAWGGLKQIRSVEIQIDNGSWIPAQIEKRNDPNAWLLWSFDWRDATPGPHTLVSRAIDLEGHIQPTEVEWRKSIRTARENNSQWPRRIVIREF
jgi:DMSO/TMAO reductase YedYZ molybdopterin-dependent catalytic subunit